MRKNNKLILTLVFLSIVALSALLYKTLPSFKTIVSDKAFEEFQSGQINMVIGGERVSLESPVMIKDGKLYFPIDFVKKHISNDMFWDENEHVLTITNPKELIRLKPGKGTYEINYKKHKIKEPIEFSNDKVYIPYALLEEKYNITATYNEETDIIILDDTTIDRVVGTVVHSSAKLRTEPDKKSPILQTIYKDEQVMTYGSQNKWTKVRTLEGNIGYINEEHVTFLKEITKEPLKKYEPNPIKNPVEGPVVMVWDQIGKASKVDFNSTKYTDMQGVNVLSPTWLEFEDAKGNLTDNGRKGYVEWAHSQGYQVWPLMSHNFTNGQWTHEVLSSTHKRDHLIGELVDFVKKYNVDGINIDIENVQEKTGHYWVQFMRELYPIMKELQITVSTDIYVPSPWTIHYNRSEIAKVVDYLVIMGYDEHWSGSEEAGSVSSLPWVQLAIEQTLDEVPEEKVILGVPFYARLWREDIDESGQLKLSSRALGMGGVKKELADQGITPIWDEATGQHYAEYEKDEGLYKVWIEDEKSMEQRVGLARQYNLAGISGWKLGLEGPEIWEVIKEQISKSK